MQEPKFKDPDNQKTWVGFKARMNEKKKEILAVIQQGSKDAARKAWANLNLEKKSALEHAEQAVHSAVYVKGYDGPTLETLHKCQAEFCDEIIREVEPQLRKKGWL